MAKWAGQVMGQNRFGFKRVNFGSGRNRPDQVDPKTFFVQFQNVYKSNNVSTMSANNILLQ